MITWKITLYFFRAKKCTTYAILHFLQYLYKHMDSGNVVLFSLFLDFRKVFDCVNSPGGSEWIISLGDYVDNSFAALGSSEPREVRLEL